jgi:hypothetical protein
MSTSQRKTFTVTHCWEHISPVWKPRPPRSFTLLDNEPNSVEDGDDGKIGKLFPEEEPDFKKLSPGELTYTVEFTSGGFSMTNDGGKKIAQGDLYDDQSLETYFRQRSDLLRLYGFEMGSTLAVFKDGTAEVIWRGSGVPVLDVLFGTLR